MKQMLDVEKEEKLHNHCHHWRCKKWKNRSSFKKNYNQNYGEHTFLHPSMFLDVEVREP
jgi:hypothetical protein